MDGKRTGVFFEDGFQVTKSLSNFKSRKLNSKLNSKNSKYNYKMKNE